MFSYFDKLRRKYFEHYVKSGRDLLEFKIFLFAFIRSLCLAEQREEALPIGFNFKSISHKPDDSLMFFIYYNPKTQAWKLKVKESETSSAYMLPDKEDLKENQDFKPLLLIMQALIADRLKNSSYFTISLESRVKDVFLNIMHEKEALK